MVTEIRTLKAENGVGLTEYALLSTDTKPASCLNGSMAMEVDTGKVFIYDAENGTWTEIGSGGGGGGTSDFSTAEVTFEGEVNIPLIYILDIEGHEAIVQAIQTWSGTVNVPLYKGTCANASDNSAYSNLTVTGDAQILDNGATLLITGDCTIAAAK